MKEAVVPTQPKIDNAYWLKRWKDSEIGWHQDAPEEALVRYFSELNPTRVLVPLCGKSLDLAWLASRGHDVVGIELSELACQTFFSEQDLPHEVDPIASLKRYRSTDPNRRITILQGDFFEVKRDQVPSLGALYDRAALIAMPPELRSRYIAQVTKLAQACGSKKDFVFLQLLLERVPTDDQGPPFSITESMLRSYYADAFKIEPLEREDAELQHASGSRTDQCAYRLTLR